MRKILPAILASAIIMSGCSVPTQTAPDTADAVINENIAEDIRAKGHITVGCKTDVPELSIFDEQTGEWSGIEIELAYLTAAQIFGVTPDEAKAQGLAEIKGVTVADREEMLENGNIDIMLATYTITDERKQRFAFSESYFTSYIGMMVNHAGTDSDSLGTSDISSLSDLDGKYIGVPRNATTRKDFLDYISIMNTEKPSPIFCEFESYDQLYDALKGGNIDVMAVDVSILNGYCDSTTLILPDRFAGQNYGAAVLKENAPLLDYVNNSIKQITE